MKTRRGRLNRKRQQRRKSLRTRRRPQRGGDGSWTIPKSTIVVWRDRRDDPYSPPIVTTKEIQEEMSEND